MAALSRIDAEGVLFPWDLAVRVVELDGGVGSLNADVAAYVERQHGGAPMFEGVRDCGEARARLVMCHRDRIMSYRTRNRALQDCGDHVIFSLGGASDDGLTNSLVGTMLDGQRLFNLLGMELLSMADGAEVADADGRALITQLHNHLASALELWFERYSAEWLSIGRHAELNRVAHVVWTFADILRAGRL